jgi:hypothetical protein
MSDYTVTHVVNEFFINRGEENVFSFVIDGIKSENDIQRVHVHFYPVKGLNVIYNTTVSIFPNFIWLI